MESTTDYVIRQTPNTYEIGPGVGVRSRVCLGCKETRGRPALYTTEDEETSWFLRCLRIQLVECSCNRARAISLDVAFQSAFSRQI